MHFEVVQSLSRARLFAVSRTALRQASLILIYQPLSQKDVIQRFSRKLSSLVEAVVIDLKACPFGYECEHTYLCFCMRLTPISLQVCYRKSFYRDFWILKIKKEKNN